MTSRNFFLPVFRILINKIYFPIKRYFQYEIRTDVIFDTEFYFSLLRTFLAAFGIVITFMCRCITMQYLLKWRAFCCKAFHLWDFRRSWLRLVFLIKVNHTYQFQFSKPRIIFIGLIKPLTELIRRCFKLVIRNKKWEYKTKSIRNVFLSTISLPYHRE